MTNDPNLCTVIFFHLENGKQKRYPANVKTRSDGSIQKVWNALQKKFKLDASSIVKVYADWSASPVDASFMSTTFPGLQLEFRFARPTSDDGWPTAIEDAFDLLQIEEMDSSPLPTKAAVVEPTVAENTVAEPAVAEANQEPGQPNWDLAADLQPEQADWREAPSGPLRSDPHTGPWKKGRALVIRPKVSQLPMRCIFTNQPVTNPTTMRLNFIETKEVEMTLNEKVAATLMGLAANKMVKKFTKVNVDAKSYYVPLPVHHSYFDRHKQAENLIKGILLGVGLLCLLVGGIVFQFANRSAYDDPYYFSGSLTSMIGLVSFMVGLMVQFENKKKAEDSRRTLRVVKLDRNIAIPRVHPDIISELSDYPG